MGAKGPAGDKTRAAKEIIAAPDDPDDYRVASSRDF